MTCERFFFQLKRRGLLSAPFWRQTGEVPVWLIVGFGMLGGLAWYWYITPQQAPVWVRSWLPGPTDPNRPLYRWQDLYGREHITDEPPKGRPYDVVVRPLNTNVLPAPDEEANP